MTTKAVRGYVRDPASGAGIVDVTVALKKHNGGTTIASDTTDADGLYEFDRDTAGYAGPTYLQFTKDSTTDVSSGNVVGQIAGMIWGADVPDVFALLGIGVATGLAVSADGADMTTDVAAGVALLKDGLPYVQEAVTAVTHTTADATNPRIDRVVLRLTREGQTDQGKIERVVIAGTPAASPAAPAVTQTSATWDFQLAQVRINAGVTTIAADKVTDERTILVSATELAYVAGVTSAIQTQLNAKQPLDSDLTAIAALTSAADKVPYSTGAGTWALTDLTSAARTVLDDASTSAMRTTLDVPQVGSALTEAAEASSTPVAGLTSAAPGNTNRRYAFFTLPTTEKWYIITAIEWLNGSTIDAAGTVWSGVEMVDANPPVGVDCTLVATGNPRLQTGVSAVQKVTRVTSDPIRGGTILGVWFATESNTGQFGSTVVASANSRKDIAAASPPNANTTAWSASVNQFSVKAYYRGIS